MARDTHSPVFGPTLARNSAEAVADLLMDVAGLHEARARRGICLRARDGTSATIDIDRSPTCEDCSRS